ncbi:hypothetical protein POM88_048386 [Heracleum sosnowskyi]|uniref:Ubiquitin-like protease family profile domain-containing protein n=1 Tax=Heracleum sosnowskyi TaxID=360622 RepID=A0AAD8GTQ9_9APIA|nr:hypothetical protein POM88_048386 [Heracleum sosnowskyi]
MHCSAQWLIGEHNRLFANWFEKTVSVEMMEGKPSFSVLTYEALEDALKRALRTFNSQTGRGNRTPKVQNLAGSPKQPSSHECGYVVMRYMRDIILDEDMYLFSTKWLLKTRTSYKIEELAEVRHKTLKHIEKLM